MRPARRGVRGHSLSGIAGLVAAIANPAMFRAVVAINASPRYRDDPETGYEGGLSADAARDILDAIMGDYAAWSAGFAPIAVDNLDCPEIARDLAESLLTYRPDVTAAMMRASMDGDHRAVLPRIGVPVLIVQSPGDALVATSAGEWMAEHIPGARYRRVSSPGHFPQLADPEELAAVIGEFIDEVA